MTVDPVAFSAPLYIAWELTHRCNAQCVHCYSASGPTAATATDLTTQEALEIIDDLAESGLLVLAFSGGEPMLRADWRDLVAHAVGRGLSVNIGTNGSTVTPRIADELRDLGVTSVTVSIDSDNPEVHDAFRGLAGLWSRATNAIRLLADRNVRAVAGFTPTRLNWNDGRNVVDLAYALGARAANLSEYVPAGRGGLDLALAPAELHQVLLDWIELREQYRGRMDVIWHDCRVGMLVPDDEKRRYVGCGAGRLVARILPDGTVTPCVFLPTVIGSLRDERFRGMWSRSVLLRQFRQRSGQVTGNCGDCEHLGTCGGCRAVAYAYSGGDPLAGDPHCWIKQADAGMAGLVGGESLPV